jgi:hypothetical protein
MAGWCNASIRGTNQLLGLEVVLGALCAHEPHRPSDRLTPVQTLGGALRVSVIHDQQLKFRER